MEHYLLATGNPGTGLSNRALAPLAADPTPSTLSTSDCAPVTQRPH